MDQSNVALCAKHKTCVCVLRTRKETETLYLMNSKWCIAGIASFADNNILSLGLTTVLDTSQFTIK